MTLHTGAGRAANCIIADWLTAHLPDADMQFAITEMPPGTDPTAARSLHIVFRAWPEAKALEIRHTEHTTDGQFQPHKLKVSIEEWLTANLL